MSLSSGKLVVCSQGQSFGFSPGDLSRDRSSAHSMVINLWTPGSLGIALWWSENRRLRSEQTPRRACWELPGMGWGPGLHMKGLWGARGKMTEKRREPSGCAIMPLISKGALAFLMGFYTPCSGFYLQSWSSPFASTILWGQMTYEKSICLEGLWQDLLSGDAGGNNISSAISFAWVCWAGPYLSWALASSSDFCHLLPCWHLWLTLMETRCLMRPAANRTGFGQVQSYKESFQFRCWSQSHMCVMLGGWWDPGMWAPARRAGKKKSALRGWEKVYCNSILAGQAGFYLGLWHLSESFFLGSFLEIDILFLEIKMNLRVEFSTVRSRFFWLQVTKILIYLKQKGSVLSQ